MSIEIMRLVWKTDIGPATHRLVLLAIADAASDEGVAWPFMATLARKAGCSLSGARAACAALEKAGLLVRHYRKKEGADGGITNASTLYQVVLPALRARVVEFDEPTVDLDGVVPPRQILADPPPNPGGPPAKSWRQNPKKIPKKNPNPSGGASADAAPPSRQEPTMTKSTPATASKRPSPRTTKNAKTAANPTTPVEQPGLFAAPPTPKTPANRPERPAGAQHVVAAYVDSHKAARGGTGPIKPHINRVGRDAAAMLRANDATVDELVAAATAMGATRFANLGVQLDMVRQRAAGRSGRGPGKGFTRELPRDHQAWDDADAKNAAANATALAEMDEAARAEFDRIMAGVL